MARSLIPIAMTAVARRYAVFAWANGDSWEDAVGISEVEEGDFAMLVLRTADNLRHVRALDEVFPLQAAAAARALDLILRDPVI